jgi:hypothetical protein
MKPLRTCILKLRINIFFNLSWYKYKPEHKGNIYYYNEPEGYVSQIIYIRTESDEDYSLKLIMKDKETFQKILF